MMGFKSPPLWLAIAIISLFTSGGVYYFAYKSVDIARQETKEVTHYRVKIHCNNCDNNRWGQISVSILRGQTVISSGVKCPKCDIPFSFGREK